MNRLTFLKTSTLAIVAAFIPSFARAKDEWTYFETDGLKFRARFRHGAKPVMTVDPEQRIVKLNDDGFFVRSTDGWTTYCVNRFKEVQQDREAHAVFHADCSARYAGEIAPRRWRCIYPPEFSKEAQETWTKNEDFDNWGYSCPQLS
jgi:hypothetical protein